MRNWRPDKSEVRMKSRTMKVALAIAAFFLMCGASFAQSPWWGQNRGPYGNWGYQDRNRDGRDDRYERGLRDGRSDREHHRAWHPRDGNAAYMNGYRAGYGTNSGGWQGRRDNDRDRDVYRGPNAPYPNGPYGGPGVGNTGRVAYNNGYQEGLRYGQNDRSAGRRYTPTSSGVYSDATRGYNSSYGDKTSYRLQFRNGYQAGYQRGFYGR